MRFFALNLPLLFSYTLSPGQLFLRCRAGAVCTVAQVSTRHRFTSACADFIRNADESLAASAQAQHEEEDRELRAVAETTHFSRTDLSRRFSRKKSGFSPRPSPPPERVSFEEARRRSNSPGASLPVHVHSPSSPGRQLENGAVGTEHLNITVSSSPDTDQVLSLFPPLTFRKASLG